MTSTQWWIGMKAQSLCWRNETTMGSEYGLCEVSCKVYWLILELGEVKQKHFLFGKIFQIEHKSKIEAWLTWISNQTRILITKEWILLLSTHELWIYPRNLHLQKHIPLHNIPISNPRWTPSFLLRMTSGTIDLIPYTSKILRFKTDKIFIWLWSLKMMKLENILLKCQINWMQ